jgi:phage repressor protein C with HTH and peptisase S24 domain
VSQLVNGSRTPSYERMVRIAGAFDVDVPGFFNIMGVGGSGEPDEYCYVPRVKAVFAAGDGSLVTDDTARERYAFRSDWLAKKGSVSAMRLVYIDGDSMEPTLKDGDMVLLDTSQTFVSSGKIYGIRVDDELMLKRLNKIPGGLEVVSDNRALFPPFAVDMDETASVEIIGRMVWSAREY